MTRYSEDSARAPGKSGDKVAALQEARGTRAYQARDACVPVRASLSVLRLLGDWTSRTMSRSLSFAF